jgi:hypothetical protein
MAWHEARWQVSDLFGRVLKTWTESKMPPHEQFQVDVSGYAAGQYFISVDVEGKGKAVEAFIKAGE